MNDELKEVIEIRDRNINSEALVDQVRKNLCLRRNQAQEQGLDYDAFVRGKPAGHGYAPFGYKLHYSLERMKASYNRIEVTLSLTDSCIPVIGSMVQRVREALHELVMFYTNRLAGRQSRFNKYVVTAMTELVEETGKENEILHREILALERRIDNLENEPRVRQSE